MLTSDLVRTRVVRGEVRPRYVDPSDPSALSLADELIGIYAKHVGGTREEITRAVQSVVGEGTDFLLYRGLAKLLDERSDFRVDAPIEPAIVRRAVFEAAARAHPVARQGGDAVHAVTRDAALADAARQLGIDTSVVDAALYADLESAHRLAAFEAIAPEALLHRYNLALAQAVLLRATRVVVQIASGDPARFRQIFRWVKFFRLMHTVQGDRERGYSITLDGPASVLSLSTRYGLQLAEFLPALALASEWTMTADLQWGRERVARTFRVSSDSGLRSHYPDRGVYVTDEEAHLRRRMEQSQGDWLLEKRADVVALGTDAVLVPDFTLRHRGDGREAHVEVVGFWRKSWLEARWQAIREHGPANLILVVSTRLHVETEARELPVEWVSFKDVIPIRELLERAERVARVRDVSPRPASTDERPISQRSRARSRRPEEGRH